MKAFKTLSAAALLLAATCSARAQAPSLLVDDHFVHYSDCAEQTVVLTYPAVLFAGLLPAGFSFAPAEAGGLFALVHVSGSHCADGGDGAPVSDVLAFVEVIPPPELQAPDVFAYGIFLRGWVQRPQTAASFAAWGFGDLVGVATVKVGVQTALGVRTGKSEASDARGGVKTSTVASGPTLAFPAARARLFRVQNGVATHAIEGDYAAQKTRSSRSAVWCRPARIFCPRRQASAPAATPGAMT